MTYCACVSPNGASARSTATRHFIDNRQTRCPGVGCIVLLMPDTVHGYYVHGYYVRAGAPTRSAALESAAEVGVLGSALDEGLLSEGEAAG